MTHRALLALILGASAASASFVVACSSKHGDGFDPGAVDASTTNPTPGVDGSPGGGGHDAGDGSTGPVFDAGHDTGGPTPVGNCSPLKGSCDLVLQDCPMVSGSPQECAPVRTQDGGVGAACVAVNPNNSLSKGAPCCSAADGTDSCLGGLTCIGGETCVDGGAPSGRCSPRCCEGDDSVCGNDAVSGGAGKCSLTIVDDNSAPLYRVCTYSDICRPLGVTPCSAGHVCIVSDSSGTAKCSQIFAPNGGAGATFDQSCPAANGCQEGLACLSSGDAGAKCQYMCHVANTTTPFDAGVLTTDPGKGGCPASKPTCRAVPNLYPAWLGICQ